MVGSRQEIVGINFGSREEFTEGLGPVHQNQDRAFRDFDEPRYIDRRQSSGIHCMDDRVNRPGIQLPGGWLETRIASAFFNPLLETTSVRTLYRTETNAIIAADPRALWVHSGCAAAANKRQAILAAAEDTEDAIDFTATVLEYMKVRAPEGHLREAVMVGAERANQKSLWNLNFDTFVEKAKTDERIKYEEFDCPHIVGGLRIDTTPNRFNNPLFKAEHRVSGEPVGALNVSFGAFKKYLESLARQGRYYKDRIPSDMAYATLFTYGLARAKVHSYGRAGIVLARNR